MPGGICAWSGSGAELVSGSPLRLVKFRKTISMPCTQKGWLILFAEGQIRDLVRLKPVGRRVLYFYVIDSHLEFVSRLV